MAWHCLDEVSPRLRKEMKGWGGRGCDPHKRTSSVCLAARTGQPRLSMERTSDKSLLLHFCFHINRFISPRRGFCLTSPPEVSHVWRTDRRCRGWKRACVSPPRSFRSCGEFRPIRSQREISPDWVFHFC